MAKQDNASPNKGVGVGQIMNETVTKKEEEKKDEFPANAEVEAKKEETGEKVEIDKSNLQSILSQLEDLKKRQDEIFETADQRQIQKIDQLRRQGKLIKSVRLRKIQGKVAVGWRTVKDDVYFDGNILKENQVFEVWYADGAKEEMPLRTFTRSIQYFPCEVISERKEADGEMYLKVKAEDGSEYEINEKYVN